MSDLKVKVIHGTEEDQKWIEVEGWRTGVPGLVVTVSGTIDGHYVISHLGSGRCFGPYVWPSIASAKRAAKKLGELEDWTDHYGKRNSITGRLLKEVLVIVKEEGRHAFDVMFGDAS